MMRPMKLRRAISIPEVLAAAAVVGVLIAFVSQMLIATATQQQKAERRALAAHELSNVTERIAMLTYAETTLERLAVIGLSPTVAATLPDAELAFDIDEADEDIPAKRVTIAIAWANGKDETTRPLQLIVWKHQHAEAAP